MKYAWSMPSLANDMDPQVVGEHIDQLIDKYQEHLTSDEILADARSTRSPLHKYFEWDENAAAEKYRRRQARMMMAQLTVAEKRSGKATKTAAFVLVRHSKHQRHVYINIRSAMGRPDMREQVIAKALTGLQRWVTRWGGRAELSFAEKSVERLQRRIQAELMALTS